VIDDDAKLRLDRWIADKAGQGRVMFRGTTAARCRPRALVPPTMIRLDRASDLQEEVFGPAARRALAAGELTRCSTTLPEKTARG